MVHKIGDKVIHFSFGFAEIIGIEEKEVKGEMMKYYVAKTKDMEIWMPVSDASSEKIRNPSSQKEMKDCFAVLRSKYKPFSEDRSVRKSDIQARVKIGTTHSLCELIRDLSYYKNKCKINEYEKSVLDRAILVLTDEWAFSYNIPPTQARHELNKLLVESYSLST
jgi:CarD family transcriptional regulator